MVLLAVAAAVAMAIVVRFSNSSCVCNSNDNSCDLGFSGGSSSSKDGSACRDMVGTANSSVSCNDISFLFRWFFLCKYKICDVFRLGVPNRVLFWARCQHGASPWAATEVDIPFRFPIN